MIASNRDYLFGTRITVVLTPCFSCRISTAKEGLFRRQSTMVLELPQGDPRTRGRPVAKLMNSAALRTEDRLQMHDVICKSVDTAGETMLVGRAIQKIGDSLKARGVLTDVIDIAE